MEKKKVFKYFSIFLFLFIIVVFFKIFNKKDSINTTESEIEENQLSNSNVINEVNYISKDQNGNEYIINALKGEIDLSDSSTIFFNKC